jgi:hypothetical protein
MFISNLNTSHINLFAFSLMRVADMSAKALSTADHVGYSLEVCQLKTRRLLDPLLPRPCDVDFCAAGCLQRYHGSSECTLEGLCYCTFCISNVGASTKT